MLVSKVKMMDEARSHLTELIASYSPRGERGVGLAPYYLPGSGRSPGPEEAHATANVRVRCWKFSRNPEPLAGGETAAILLRPAEEGLNMARDKCDWFRRGLKRLTARGAYVLKSPALLRLVFATAPAVYRFVRWLHRNFGDGS